MRLRAHSRQPWGLVRPETQRSIRHRSCRDGLRHANDSPPAANLIDRVGWRLTNVVLGVGSALLLSACALIVAPPPVAPHAGPERPLRPVLCSFPFLMMYSSWTLATTALFVPFVFLPQFALSNGATPVAASALLSILGGVSVLSRLGIGVLGNRIASLSLFKGAVLAMAASYIIWLVMPGYSWLVVFAICLGHRLRSSHRCAAERADRILRFAEFLGALLGVFFHGNRSCCRDRAAAGWLYR